MSYPCHIVIIFLCHLSYTFHIPIIFLSYSSHILVIFWSVNDTVNILLVLARALTALHLWTLCCWSSRSLLQLRATKGPTSYFHMPTAGTTPFCSFFLSSWQSGSLRTWLTSCVCDLPLAKIGVLLNWTEFLLSVWCLIGGAITCTLFTQSNLNPICIEESCVLGVIRSTWPSIAFVERILRCVICVCIHAYHSNTAYGRHIISILTIFFSK